MQPATGSQPLAYRLRPVSLSDFVGQDHVVGEGTPLRKAIEEDTLSSVILAGPPGTGKTTLAVIIAHQTKAQFVKLNAVLSGVKDLKEICKTAAQINESALRGRTVLFIDEIHRFNKAQQDALLPYVEAGTVILIGATTENPYFSVNAALVSRSSVYLLQPLSKGHLVQILTRAAREGYEKPVKIEKKALEHLALIANGDARIALNALELSVMARNRSDDSSIVAARADKRICAAEISQLFQRSYRYDRAGEDHYNTISAFIKTMRGSDPDAALVWLFKMIESGEDPRFLFRRMFVFASEDVGNADPQAIQLVVSSWQAFELVGLPEGEYFLAHACIYLSQAPKSNAVKRAIDSVRYAIKNAPSLEVPNFLRNAPIKGMREQGYGENYQYPHDVESGLVSANYFPVGMKPMDFYKPTNRGFELEIFERMQRAREVIRGVH